MSERRITFSPAFHRCTDPRGNYGIGSVTMLWVLVDGDWAMSWDVHTDWNLPDRAFHDAAPTCSHPMHQGGAPHHRAMGGAVDWHSPVPQYPSHEPSRECCPHTNGRCYLDSGFLLGDELFELLCTCGDEAVWLRLQGLMDDARDRVAT